ncbi:basic-leucine zipper transcription factor A-like [Solenopsis invicta]|uniref:basic-leucine zipper transcription factor A-like n=1 Tax=Solenopsis invicta TaxID=13686 RepID=UPI00193D91AF|nr:basic-leucine zipper transcription factor A-like [Solenopsis invicta]
MNNNPPASLAGGGGTGAYNGDARRLHPEVPVRPPDPSSFPLLPPSPSILTPSKFGVPADQFNDFESTLNSNNNLNSETFDNTKQFQANTPSSQDVISSIANKNLDDHVNQGHTVSNIGNNTINTASEYTNVPMEIEPSKNIRKRTSEDLPAQPQITKIN